MPISPLNPVLALNTDVELTSTLNNAMWSAVGGGETFSAGSTSYKKKVRFSTAGTKTVKAHGSYYSSYYHVYSVNPDGTVQLNASNGDYGSVVCIGALSTSGDYVDNVWIDDAGNNYKTIYFDFPARWIFSKNTLQAEVSVAISPALVTGNIVRFKRNSSNKAELWISRDSGESFTLTHTSTSDVSSNMLMFLAGGSCPIGTKYYPPQFSNDTNFESITVTVYEAVNANFTAPTSINLGQNLSVSDETTGGVGTKTRVWKIDGITVTPANADYVNPIFTGLSAGNHTIRLEVTDDSGTDSEENIVAVSSITGSATIAHGASQTYSTNVTSPIWSIVSGGGTITSSTGELTAPSSGSGLITIKATKSSDSAIFATKVVEITTRITTTSPLSNVIGGTISGSFAADGGVGSGTWSKVSGNYPTGVSVASNGTRSGTPSSIGSFSFRLRYVDSSNPSNAVEKDFVWDIADVPKTFRNLEIFQIIPCLNAKETISFARFRHQLGDGFRQNVFYGSKTGTRRWSLSYRTLAANGNEIYYVDSIPLTPAEYLWDFYCRHQVSGKPFIMTSPRTGQYYLAEFADDELSLEKIAVQLWTTGLQINQVREKDWVYQTSKFGSILQYEADLIELGDNAGLAIWNESKGGQSLTATGGVTFQTAQQNGLGIVRLNGTDGYLSLNNSYTIFHVFIVLKVTENTFNGNDGIFGDNSSSIISGVSGSDILNNGASAPMGKFGVIYFTNLDGMDLTTLVFGKNSNNYLKGDIAEIILGLNRTNSTDVLEMVEYLSTKWNVGISINAS